MIRWLPIAIVAATALLSIPARGVHQSADSVVAASPPAIPLPGTLQGEDFNDGGEGVGYHDTTPGNNGTEMSRDPSDVDLKTGVACGDLTTPCVAWMATGEWLDYTVEIAETGRYTFVLHVASGVDTGVIRFELDDVDVTRAAPVPNTGSFNTWTDMAITGVQLTAGTATLRLNVDAAGLDFDSMLVVREVEQDAGVVASDAGVAADAGRAIDAGRDAGTAPEPDASVAVDASAPPAIDAGGKPGEYVAHGSGLCAVQPGARSHAPALALGLALAFLLIRRRRR